MDTTNVTALRSPVYVTALNLGELRDILIYSTDTHLRRQAVFEFESRKYRDGMEDATAIALKAIGGGL